MDAGIPSKLDEAPRSLSVSFQSFRLTGRVVDGRGDFSEREAQLSLKSQIMHCHPSQNRGRLYQLILLTSRIFP